MSKNKKKTRKTKGAVTVKDLPAARTRTVRGGSVSNVLKTRHDTVKNSIGN